MKGLWAENRDPKFFILQRHFFHELLGREPNCLKTNTFENWGLTVLTNSKAETSRNHSTSGRGPASHSPLTRCWRDWANLGVLPDVETTAMVSRTLLASHKPQPKWLNSSVVEWNVVFLRTLTSRLHLGPCPYSALTERARQERRETQRKEQVKVPPKISLPSNSGHKS